VKDKIVLFAWSSQLSLQHRASCIQSSIIASPDTTVEGVLEMDCCIRK
jgi:hypothetical protein